MATKKDTAAVEQAGNERKELLRQAYGRATSELRENHRAEFNSLYAERAAELGVEWSPRPNEQERAEQTFDQLLTDYPHLRERLADEPAGG